MLHDRNFKIQARNIRIIYKGNKPSNPKSIILLRIFPRLDTRNSWIISLKKTWCFSIQGGLAPVKIISPDQYDRVRKIIFTTKKISMQTSQRYGNFSLCVDYRCLLSFIWMIEFKALKISTIVGAFSLYWYILWGNSKTSSIYSFKWCKVTPDLVIKNWKKYLKSIVRNFIKAKIDDFF